LGVNVLTDSSGAVIPGAPVMLIPAGTGTTQNTTTAADGSWSFVGVPGGNYTVTVHFPGFGAFEKAIAIQAGRTIDDPIQLVPEAGKQEITVSGGPGPELSLDPGSNASSATISGTDVQIKVRINAEDVAAHPRGFRRSEDFRCKRARAAIGSTLSPRSRDASRRRSSLLNSAS
jgi:hypothetical protein